jgi:hypothetical protein
LDQENMLERNCKPGWYEVTIEAVEARQFHIRHASSNRRICTVYQSHMALFPLLKTARVASGENSLSLMLYLYLLTYLLVMALPPVTKFFRREILADQQSSSRTLENQRAQI